MSRPSIKVKAMGLFVSPDGRFLASSDVDSVKQQPFLRLLGGHVEFGELSADTLRREIQEEIGADCAIGPLLEVVENIFVYEGRPGHEVVFIYAATFSDPAFYLRAEIPFVEPDSATTAIWTPCADAVEGRVFLFPTTDYAPLFARLLELSRI
jgi:8-oxo-dGTP pyrophosphatase MutT (NUDIX family)